MTSSCSPARTGVKRSGADADVAADGVVVSWVVASSVDVGVALSAGKVQRRKVAVTFTPGVMSPSCVTAMTLATSGWPTRPKPLSSLRPR